MHGSYFPPIEKGEILASHYFFAILAVILLVVAILRYTFPLLIPSSVLKGLFFISGILVVWEVISIINLVNPVLLPSPTKVFSNIVFMWSVGFLQPQIFATFFRLSYAFILALVSAIVAGIMTSYFSRRFAFLESFLNAARLIPAPAWLSLSILWFGIGHASAIFIIWLGCFFPIFLNTISGVSKAEPVQVETVITFGGDKYDVLWLVILPVAYHQIIAGARIGLGIGWITVVTAELASVDINAGLGWMINDSRILFDTTTVLSGIILIGTFGIITDSLVKSFDRFVQGWS